MITYSLHSLDVIGLREYRPDSSSDGRALIFEDREGKRKHVTLFPARDGITDNRTGREKWNDVDIDGAAIEDLPSDADNGSHLINVHGVQSVETEFSKSDQTGNSWTDYRIRLEADQGDGSVKFTVVDFN